MGQRSAAAPRVSGQIFLSRLEFVHSSHGPEAVARVLAGLAPEDRELLRGVDGRRWYPLRTLLRLDKTAARLLAPHDPEFIQRAGGAAARRIHGWLGRDAALVSPHALLARVADEHPRYFSFGSSSYRRRGFQRGELALEACPEADAAFCQAVGGYLRACLELLIGRGAQVEETECQTRGARRCAYRLEWSARAG